MNAGELFEKGGVSYTVKVSGTGFKEDQKNCILPKGQRRCISIGAALKKGLIIQHPYSDSELFERSETSSVRERPFVCPSNTPKSDKTAMCKNKGCYFMPVDPLRAQVFLAHGLIYPSIYDGSGLASEFDDSQSSAAAELTLYSDPQPLAKDHLQLQLFLHPTEVENASTFEKGLRLPVPLPISRVVDIQVGKQIDDVNRYLAGWVKPDVPVPAHLFRKANEGGPPVATDSTAFVCSTKARKSVDVASAIRAFDQRMGALAFLRNANRYLSGTTGKYADYPASFFALAAAVMGTSLTTIGQPMSPPALSLLIFGLAALASPDEKAVERLVTSGKTYIDKETARNCAKELFTATGKNDDLAKAFTALFKNNDYRTAIRDLQRHNIPTSAAILATLFKFSNKNGEARRSIKQRLHDDWSSSEKMEAALCAVGAYYGYTALDARETRLYNAHPYIKSIVEDTPSIKFTLATRFERHLIEAVYQLSFFGRYDNKDAVSLDDAAFDKNADPISHHGNAFIKDESYSVQDLLVRRYTITKLGHIFDRLRSCFRNSLDESSQTGRYLMWSCFFFAESYEISKNGINNALHYRISTDKVINLLSEGRITIDANVLEATLAADVGADTQ